MVDKIKMEEILKAYPQYRDALFCRGYLITDDFSVNKETYPFYDQWNVEKVKNLGFVYSPKSGLYALRR